MAAERDRMIAALRATGWTVPGSQANFVWLRTTDAGRTQLLRAFDAADILVRGYGVLVTVAEAACNDQVIRVLTGQLVAA